MPGYDYAQAGAYFVTICTHERVHLFGKVTEGVMVLNRAGEIAEDELSCLPASWPDQVELDVYVVMPNHIHAILVLVGTAFLPSAATSPATKHSPDAQKRVPTLGNVIGSYKSGVTRCIRETRKQTDLRVWQTRYHDHIIRNESDLNRIREYTINNPAQWQQDIFYGV